MKITTVEPILVRTPLKLDDAQPHAGGLPKNDVHTVLVKVETDEGLTGWGEAFSNAGWQSTCTAIAQIIAPRVLGRDPSQIAQIQADLHRGLYNTGRSGPTVFAISGLDIALWDIAAKRACLPLYSPGHLVCDLTIAFSSTRPRHSNRGETMNTQTRPDYDRPLFSLHNVSSIAVIIEGIDLVRWRDVHFLRARSKDGTQGLVMINEGRHFLTAMLKERILPFFAGRDARDLETMIDEIYVYKWNYKYAGSAFWTTVAWAEAAVLDLLGKASGKSIGDLLGGRKRDQVPVYVSSLIRNTTPQEEVEWVGRRIEQTKAKAVKLKIGGRLSKNADASPGRTERLIALARQTWGGEMKLYVDANGSYDARYSLEVAKMLKEHDVVFFEEPCPFEDLDETKAVADALDMPVAGGEQDASLPRFEYMARNRVVDILQPDMLYNGGFIRNHRTNVIARHYGLPLTPHSPYLGPRQALSTHFCATLPELPIEMEYAAALPEHPMDWYCPQIEVKDGLVAVPTGPGLGIEFAPEVVNGLQIVD